VTVVIDANALVALIASEPDGPAISALIERWTAEDVTYTPPRARATRSPTSSRASTRLVGPAR